MPKYAASIVVPVEYTVSIEADSLDEAQDKAHELEGGDVHGMIVESFGTVRVLNVEEA